jgi:3-isopropylmalate/(R)-2-methylmalate dehydratase small subunit
MSKGRAWRFGDDVNTDLIIPGKYLDNYDPDHLARHAMEGASKEFATKVATGDIIIAGSNFGCGSSREQAVIALKRAGVRAIVARSFARIFYRNAVNLGLAVVVSNDSLDGFHDGDAVLFDDERGSLASADGQHKATLEPIPPHLKKILDKGGLIPYIKERLKSR